MLCYHSYPYYCLPAKAARFYSGNELCRTYFRTNLTTNPEDMTATQLFFFRMEELYKRLSKGDNAVKGLHEQALEWEDATIEPADGDTGGKPKKIGKRDVKNYAAWIRNQVQQAWEVNLSQMYSGDPEEEPLFVKFKSQQISLDTDITVSHEVQFDTRTETYPRPVDGVALVSTEIRDGTESVPLNENIDSKDLPSKTSYYNADINNRNLVSGLNGINMHLVLPPAISISDGYWLGRNANAVKDPHLERFVMSLHHQKFGLSEKPSLNSSATFLDKGEWNSWFSDVLSSTHMQMFTDGHGEPSAFIFKMSLPVAGGRELLTFSIDQIKHSFALTDSFTTMGLIEDTGIMVFGLDAASGVKVSTTLSSVMDYIGLNQYVKSPLIQTLGNQLVLSLSAGEGSRNAVWFQPGLAYRVTQRLQWKIDLGHFLQTLKKDWSIDLPAKSVDVVTSRMTYWRPGPELLYTGQLLLEIRFDDGLLGSLSVYKDFFRLTITSTKSSFPGLISWLQNAFSGISVSELESLLTSAMSIGEQILKNVQPRRVYVEKHKANANVSRMNWGIDIEVAIKDVSFLISYTSATGNLRGQVWFVREEPIYKKLLPSWEESDSLKPVLVTSPAKDLDLREFLSESEVHALPQGISTKLTEVVVEINNKSISFSASLVFGIPSDQEPVPPILFGNIDLSLNYFFASKDNISLEFYVTASLSPKPTDSEEDEDDISADEAALDGMITYEDGEWILRASISALNFGSISSLLDPSAREDVLSILGNMELSELELIYHYQKDGKSKDFSLVGVVDIGELTLEMSYRYNAFGWEFNANLGTSTQEATVGSVIESILGPDDNSIPPFIANIRLSTSKGENLVSIHCRKERKENQGGFTRENCFLYFQATLRVAITKDVDVSITFAQYRDLQQSSKTSPIRILKIALATVPTVDVPTLGKLPQPFDEIAYMWIQDKDPSRLNANKAGLTADEVTYINRGLSSDSGVNQAHEPWLFFRDTRKPGEAKGTDRVLVPGSHLVVMLNAQGQRKAILDYVFGSEGDKKLVRGEVYAGSSSGGGGGDSAMAAYQKTAGKMQ